MRGVADGRLLAAALLLPFPPRFGPGERRGLTGRDLGHPGHLGRAAALYARSEEGCAGDDNLVL
ncbi:MAG: hypothetical protein ACLUEK_11945 [Oscillospiraceae bacterium]